MPNIILFDLNACLHAADSVWWWFGPACSAPGESCRTHHDCCAECCEDEKCYLNPSGGGCIGYNEW